MKILGPRGFERSHTLEGTQGEHDLRVISAIILKCCRPRFKSDLSGDLMQNEYGVHPAAVTHKLFARMDGWTRDHSRRVTHYSTAVANAIGLSSAATASIRDVALLHEVGKLEIPSPILHKKVE